MPQSSGPTFSQYLRILRRRARLTQAELGIAVGYSDAQICRLETGRRAPDLAMLVALFLPALELDPQSAEAQQLLKLAAGLRAGEPASQPQPTPSSASPSILPYPADPLIGRAAEQELIRERLASGAARLISMIGPAGIGKTRLALHMAHSLRSQYRDGVAVIDLSALDLPEQVLPALAQALDIPEESAADIEMALRTALAGRECLLVLDNMEQLVEAAPKLQGLLDAAPKLALLVTSRIALRIRAEHTFALAPLALPDLARMPAPAALEQIESVALLLARLRKHTPALEITPANALALAAICVRVDGMPLAIELVAAHGRLFTPQELLSEVAHQFLHMRQRGRDIPARHTTLTAALTWSYEQLAPATRALLARLSAFTNGWTIDAALAACDLDGDGRAIVLMHLEYLLDHSLIQRHSNGEATRFSMLAMVREFASARLDERCERASIQARMLNYFIDLAIQADQNLAYGADQNDWIARIEAEHDNLRACLQWALAHAQASAGLRLAGAIGRFWHARGYLREGRRWLEAFLEQPAPPGEPFETIARARALDAAGLLAWRQGDFAQAEAWYAAALAIFQRLALPNDVARVRMRIGLAAADRGAIDSAIEQYEASLALYRESDNPVHIAAVLHNLGNLYCQQNSNQRALALYEECLPLYEQIGDHSGIALIMLGVGCIARDQGDLAKAEAAFLRSRDIAQSGHNDWNVATALLNLGDIAADRADFANARHELNAALALAEPLGDQQTICVIHARLGAVELLDHQLPAALALFRQSLLLAHAIGFQAGIAEALEGLAGCVAQPQPLRAARLLAASAQMRTALKLPRALADQPRYERTLRVAQRNADLVQWAVAWGEGQRIGSAQAVALALTYI